MYSIFKRSTAITFKIIYYMYLCMYCLSPLMYCFQTLKWFNFPICSDIERTWWRLLRTWWRLLRTWWRLLRTWWRLFRKRVVRTRFDIYVFIEYNSSPSIHIRSTLFIWFDLIWFLVFNATFSNISAISWRPVLVVEEAGVPGKNQTMGKQLVTFITCGCESSAPFL